MSKKTQSPDEVSKKKTADKLVSKKAKYFVPQHSITVEAGTPDEAAKKAKKLMESKEVGDE